MSSSAAWKVRAVLITRWQQDYKEIDAVED